METPTTVKVINDGNTEFSNHLIVKFLSLGYNVVPINCTHERIKNHRFVRTSTKTPCHSEFKVFLFGVILYYKNEKYLFLFDDSYITDDEYTDMEELSEFIIGTWGTIRGNRCLYKSNIITMTEEVINDWRTL